jgi:hypothetical protein
LLKALNADSRPVGGKKHRCYSFFTRRRVETLSADLNPRFEIAFSRWLLAFSLKRSAVGLFIYGLRLTAKS